MTSFSVADGSIVAEAAYGASFGNLPNRTVYKHYPPTRDGVGSIETTANLENGTINLQVKSVMGNGQEIKALTTSANEYATGTSYSTTSGNLPILLPIYLDPTITDVTKFKTPLYSGLLKKVTNRGLYADFNQLTAKGAAAFKAEDAALTEADDTYARVTKPIVFAYSVGRVTGPMLAAMREYQDAMRLEVSNKRQALAELLETQICQGTSNDSNGFSGFDDLVTTNTLDKSSTTITLANLRTAIRTIREAKGTPDLIVTDYKTLDDIKALMTSFLRYNAPTTNIGFGIQAVEFEGLPIVVTLGMSTTTNSRELHIYDTSVWELRVLQDETMEELAKTNDSVKFMIKWYGVLITKAEQWNYRIYGLV